MLPRAPFLDRSNGLGRIVANSRYWGVLVALLIVVFRVGFGFEAYTRFRALAENSFGFDSTASMLFGFVLMTLAIQSVLFIASYVLLGREYYKAAAWGLLFVAIIGVFSATVGRSVCFDTDGSPTKWFADTPDGRIFRDHPGVDPKTGMPLRPYTAEQAKKDGRNACKPGWNPIASVLDKRFTTDGASRLQRDPNPPTKPPTAPRTAESVAPQTPPNSPIRRTALSDHETKAAAESKNADSFVVPDRSAVVASQTQFAVMVQLQGCQRHDTTVRCHFLLTNRGQDNTFLFVSRDNFPGEAPSVWDEQGEVHLPDWVRVGEHNVNEMEYNRVLLQDVAVLVTLQSSGVPSTSTKLTRLVFPVYFAYNQRHPQPVFEFRNVALTP